MTICHTTDTTFKSDLKPEGFTLVNFWAPWCGPCRNFAPILESFDQKYSNDVRILKVNADEEPNIAAHYGIMSLPTTILFKDGNPIKKTVGMVSINNLEQFVSENTN